VSLIKTKLLNEYLEDLIKRHEIPLPLKPRIADILENTAIYQGAAVHELTGAEQDELAELFDESDFDTTKQDLFKGYMKCGPTYALKPGREQQRSVASKIFRKTGVCFYPSIDEALYFSPIEKIIPLFESEYLPQLGERVGFIRALNPKLFPTLYFTHSDLAKVFQKFKKHLVKNKDVLIRTGYSGTYFEDSLVLNDSFANILPTRKPNHVKHYVLKHNLSYYWGKEMGVIQDASSLYRNDELESSLEDIKLIRSTLFDIKLKFIELFRKHLLHGNCDTLWKECKAILTDCLTSDQIHLLDNMTSGLIPFYKLERTLLDEGKNIIAYVESSIDFGSLRTLIEWVLYVETEIKHGYMDSLKISIESHESGKYLKSYYQLLGHPDLDLIHNKIDAFLSVDNDFEKEALSIRSRLNTISSEKTHTGVNDKYIGLYSFFKRAAKFGSNGYFDFSEIGNVFPLHVPGLRIIDGVLHLKGTSQYMQLTSGDESPKKKLIEWISLNGSITRGEFDADIKSQTNTNSRLDYVVNKINDDVRNSTAFNDKFIVNLNSHYIFNPIYFL
jgi:hypothetical protein